MSRLAHLPRWKHGEHCAAAVLALAACGTFVAAEPHGGEAPETSEAAEPPDFTYDAGDTRIEAAVGDHRLDYDPDVAVAGGTHWYAWLRFTPGEGDRVWVGARCEGEWVRRRAVAGDPGAFSRPTLTADREGTLWLSYEERVHEQWDVFAVRLAGDGVQGEVMQLSAGDGADIRHDVAADPAGGLWFTWQSDRDGQFDILARRATAAGPGPVAAISESPHGDWHPRVAAAPDGTVHVAWDGYDGDDYDVFLRTRRRGEWGAASAIAHTPAFEGRVDLAADTSSRLWIVWEEGGENWGEPFRGIRTPKVADDVGPLHRFRRLRLAVRRPVGTVHALREPLPMPMADRAIARSGAEEQAKRTGVFYERARLAVDARGRPWVAYRHVYAPWIGFVHRSHVEQGWGVYARHLTAGGWSPLYRFGVGQGDGLQRLELSSNGNGVSLVWTTGRTDRRSSERPRGVVSARAGGEGRAPGEAMVGRPRTLSEPVQNDPPDPPPPATVDGREYELFFGDLHRHTDLSLCRVPVDGTIDDAYRYAIDPGGLDFLGITDHSRDIARGDALSQLWWRSRKQVGRHRLGDRFFPFFAFERSHGRTADHNVISLRPDVLRPHTYPVPEFWQELDEHTITIPHQPVRRDTWKYQDDALRPLVEIYQGCRDRAIESHVHEGLDKGYHLGFIASSDHMSTHASFACVWAPDRSRESIFEALQARRTYGATAKIRLVALAGDRWMGRTIDSHTVPRLSLDARGTASIDRVDLVVDGEVHETIEPGEQRVRWKPSLELEGRHYVYFRLVQSDGNRAWSSPVWLDVD